MVSLWSCAPSPTGLQSGSRRTRSGTVTGSRSASTSCCPMKRSDGRRKRSISSPAPYTPKPFAVDTAIECARAVALLRYGRIAKPSSPNLIFGPGVEDNLKDSAHLFQTIIGKLVHLDRSAEEWRARGGPAPPWRTRVSPESVERMKNAAFRAARRFRSRLGTVEMFEWHARYGDSGRIHLRFDPEIPGCRNRIRRTASALLIGGNPGA